MATFRHLVIGGFLFLAGCGGGVLPPTEFLAGGLSVPGNGLPAADGTQTFADLEGETMTVRLARFVTDYESGETKILISDEEVVAGAGYGVLRESSFTLSIGGTPVALVDGAGTAANGQGLATYINTSGAQSGTLSVYGYAYGDQEALAGDFDMEAYHAFGFETAPTSVAGMSGAATFRGSYFGFGQVLDPGGGVIEAEVENNGILVLTADFSKGYVGGAMAGTIEAPEPREYTARIFTTTIVGNGFGSAIVLDCPPEASCASSSLIGGAFYGPGADEISGVMGFDEALDDERYLGAAGFTASR